MSPSDKFVDNLVDKLTNFGQVGVGFTRSGQWRIIPVALPLTPARKGAQ